MDGTFNNKLTTRDKPDKYTMDAKQLKQLFRNVDEATTVEGRKEQQQ